MSMGNGGIGWAEISIFLQLDRIDWEGRKAGKKENIEKLPIRKPD
jgi:hypothetical protein